MSSALTLPSTSSLRRHSISVPTSPPRQEWPPAGRLTAHWRVGQNQRAQFFWSARAHA
jgi:hypothetical protein